MLLATVRRKPARRSGFTLMEVLVVVAILVMLATVATIATSRYLDDAKKARAQLGCTGLAQAIEAYTNNPQNTNSEPPTSPMQLVQPTFGGQAGQSFLRNGAADINDPWGKTYQFQQQTKGDGTTYILVTTTAPDGTVISQFGIGAQNAQPKF